MTIHIIGAEKECDLLPLFECLLPFFPKCHICIHMIGPEVSKHIEPAQRAIMLKSVSNDSTIFVTVQNGLYSPDHFSGVAFKLPKDFPTEMSNNNNFGQTAPDVVIAMNAALMAYPEWAQSLRTITEGGGELYVTDRMESTCYQTVHSLGMINSHSNVTIQTNPFRQPMIDFKKDVNLVGFSNGFIYSIAGDK